MPLLDHFHFPQVDEAPWESFCTMWIGSLVAEINHQLPRDRFRAYANLHLGPQVAADIAEFEALPTPAQFNGEGGIAVSTSAPPALLTMPALFPGDAEVKIHDIRGSHRLVAVIELVSPANKKELAERRAFVAKCSAYLQHGIGLTIIDVVTERRSNLHDELVRFLDLAEPYTFPEPTLLYATSYRPTHRDGKSLIDLWRETLSLGEPLPIIALPLKGSSAIPLDLEATYQEARDRSNF